MLIGLDWDMTPIDIELIKSMSEGSHLWKKMVSPIIFWTVYHRAFIFHMLIGPGEGLTPIEFVFLGQGSRSQGSPL